MGDILTDGFYRGIELGFWCWLIFTGIGQIFRLTHVALVGRRGNDEE